MATFDDDDDLEYLAIGKCSKALSVLDNESRIRVIRYLLDKFGLIEQSSFNPRQAQKSYQHENLAIEEKEDENTNSSHKNLVTDKPSIKDIIVKDYAKTAADLALVIAYYETNFGNTTFVRQRFLDVYRENNIYNDQRRKALTGVVNSLIKKSYLKTITENTYTILHDGVKQAELIIAGNSTSVSKNRGKKK